MTGIGLKKVVAALATFFAVLWLSSGATTIMGVTGDLAMAQTSIFVWLGLSHGIRIVAIRWDEGWSGRQVFVNRWVNYSLLWPLVSYLVILYTPLAGLFKAVPLPLWVWGVLAVSIALSMALAIGIVDIIDHLLGGYSETEY